ncbi:hypothetical protein Q3G72_018491 [Acer saccharum]|nr:hypothetical protein Q3G72_018491 [Acer saccharum]
MLGDGVLPWRQRQPGKHFLEQALKYETPPYIFRKLWREMFRAGTTVELGKEDGGVGLRLWALDPLKTRSDTAILAQPL